MSELRYAFRQLWKSPVFSLIAIAILALGIGANTAIFSAVNALLIRPLPIEDAGRMVCGYAMRDGFDPFETSLLEYAAYRAQNHSLGSTGIGGSRSFNTLVHGTPERLRGAAVTVDYLTTLGVRPWRGRLFLAEENRPGGAPVALISYQLSQRLFAGAPESVGQSLLLGDRNYTVVGILPAGFNMPFAADLWVPLQLDPESLPLQERARNNYEMIARLRPGVTLRQADADLKAIARQLEQEHPQIRRGWSYRLIGLRDHLLGDMEGRSKKALLTLSAAVGFVLLICCANLASLLLVPGVVREREIGLRFALGASPGRIVRQLLSETLLLALGGGGLGALLAFWITPVIAALSPIQAISLADFLGDFRVDARVLGFAFLLSLLTAVICGLVPALKMARSHDLAGALKQREQRTGGSSRARRLLSSFVIGEIVFAVILLVSGGLMVQTFQRIQKVELGFRPDNLLMVDLPLAPNQYVDHGRRVIFATQVLERVKAMPVVLAAVATTNVPLHLFAPDSTFALAERPTGSSGVVPITAHRLVSPGYLETLGVILLKGRLITEQDTAGKLPVVVVSETLARQAWPGEDPIGKTIKRGRSEQTDRPWLTVVGVIADIKEDRFNFRIDRPVWYLPYAQEESQATLNLLVRSRGSPGALVAAVRDAIRAIDPQQPLSDITTMKEHLAEVLVRERFSAILMGSLAAIGLLLAAIGLYGVMAYSVTQRTGEIGVRMALGARTRDILRLVLGHGFVLVSTGLAIGLFLALASTRALAGTLYGISPTDPFTFTVAALFLILVALLACLIPARRASLVNPIEALRTE